MGLAVNEPAPTPALFSTRLSVERLCEKSSVLPSGHQSAEQAVA